MHASIDSYRHPHRHSHCHARRHQRRRISATRGLGLIEALLSISLLMTLAMPVSGAMAGLLDRVQLNAAVSELRFAIQSARMHAIQRAQRVDVVPVVDGDWSRGWIVLVDANNNQRLDPGEAVLRERFHPAPALRVSANLTDSRRSYLAFGAGGRPRTATSPTQSQFGSFLLTHGSEIRKLVTGFLGRVRSCDPVREGAAC